MSDRIPPGAHRSGYAHFMMAQCCEKQMNRQSIDHISHPGPIKTALNNIKS